jgi:hypothetical protein
VVAFDPEDKGEGLRLTATAIDHAGGMIGDVRGSVDAVEQRARALTLHMLPSVWPPTPGKNLQAEFWLFPLENARTFGLRIEICRAGDGKRLLTKTLHVSPSI